MKLPAIRRKTEANGKSAFRRALDRFRARDEDRRSAARQAAIAAAPPRFTKHRCAVTGETWLYEWRRTLPNELYRVQRKHKSAQAAAAAPKTGRGGSASTSVSTAVGGSFDPYEFDWDTGPCEGCGHTRLFVNCHCGQIVCGGRSTFYKKAEPFFKCHESCGRQFNVVYHFGDIAAHEGPAPKAKAPPRGKKKTALPKRDPLLPGRSRNLRT